MRKISYSIDRTPDGKELYRPQTLTVALARLKRTPNSWLMRYSAADRWQGEPILSHEEDGEFSRFIHTLGGDLSSWRLRRAGIR